MVMVIELSDTGSGNSGGLSVKGAQFPDANSAVASQSIDIGGSASAAFNVNTTYVEVFSDTACFVEIGANPDGNGITFPVVANVSRFFGVEAGHKIIAVS